MSAEPFTVSLLGQRITLGVAAILLVFGVTVASQRPAAATPSSCEAAMAADFPAQVNAERSARGFPAAQSFDATSAQQWAEHLRDVGGFSHSPPDYARGYGFAAYNEDLVAIPTTSTSGSATSQFMISQPHRAWILSQHSWPWVTGG